jgi:NADPH:quinone reductase-like Zn-dependent oxidoreductase
MKAIVQDRYGSPDVLRLADIDTPVANDDQVLVRVQAAAVNIGDWHLLRGTPYIMRIATGPFKPRHDVPGLDLAGQVESVGKAVTQLRPGDEVFGWCRGAFAEYACAEESNFLPKPADLTLEQSAAVGDSAFTALNAVRDQGKVQPGHEVLINGASGGVGTFAVQIAKSFGATVTGVCSTRNVDLVRSVGADEVIDYTQEDFTRRGERYDAIFDVAANRSLSDLRRVLKPGGTLVLVGADKRGGVALFTRIISGFARSRLFRQRIVFFVAKATQDDLLVLKDLIETGKVCPAIDRTYPLNEAVEAVRYVGTGQARAKVVITM